MTDFVYPGYVTSKYDGGQHWVSGRDLIWLYGLNPATTVIVDRERNMVGYSPDDLDRHFYPRQNGNYKKATR